MRTFFVAATLLCLLGVMASEASMARREVPVGVGEPLMMRSLHAVPHLLEIPVEEHPIFAFSTVEKYARLYKNFGKQAPHCRVRLRYLRDLSFPVLDFSNGVCWFWPEPDNSEKHKRANEKKGSKRRQQAASERNSSSSCGSEKQFITGSFLLLTSNRFKSLRPRFLCYGTGIVAAPHLYKQQLADCLLFDPFASGTRVIRDRQGAVQLPVLPTLELS